MCIPLKRAALVVAHGKMLIIQIVIKPQGHCQRLIDIVIHNLIFANTHDAAACTLYQQLYRADAHFLRENAVKRRRSAAPLHISKDDALCIITRLLTDTIG